MNKKIDTSWSSGDILYATQMNQVVDAVNSHINKQDIIDDLDTIRANATLGGTAVQPEAISDMLTKTEAKNIYADSLDSLTAKQIKIPDLDVIRANATLGSTAVQPEAISDILMKDECSIYTPKTLLDSLVSDSNSIKNAGETDDVTHLIGSRSSGELLKITPDDYEKSKVFFKSWGVIINPNDSSPELETVGNYACWESFKENVGRYLLTNAGKAIKLSKTDSSVAIDGTTIDETIGHVMVRIPQLYYNVVSNKNGTYTLWMSKHDIGGHLMPEIWIGAYLAYSDGTKLISRSGFNPTRQKTITEFFNLAQANGSDFGLGDYNFRRAIMMLYLSEYHNLNSQLSLGYGMSSSYSNWGSEVEGELTGRTKAFGDICDKVFLTDLGIPTMRDDACHVSLFGIEDPYAWFWEFVQGVYCGSTNNAEQDGTEIFIYEGNRLPTSSELTTHPDSKYGEYRQLTKILDDGDWIKTIIAGPYFDLFPSTLGGSSSTYWCDCSGDSNKGQVLIWGGSMSHGLNCGLGYSYSYYDWSAVYSDIGARLAYYGSPTIVQTYNELTA